MARILVSEEIAEGGLDRLRAAGHEVIVRLDLTPETLPGALVGVHALIIRSATQVTAEVLDGARDRVDVAHPVFKDGHGLHSCCALSLG